MIPTLQGRDWRSIRPAWCRRHCVKKKKNRFVILRSGRGHLSSSRPFPSSLCRWIELLKHLLLASQPRAKLREKRKEPRDWWLRFFGTPYPYPPTPTSLIVRAGLKVPQTYGFILVHIVWERRGMGWAGGDLGGLLWGQGRGGCVPLKTQVGEFRS